MSKSKVFVSIVGVSVLVVLIVFIVSGIVSNKEVTVQSTESLMDTTPADIANVDENKDYFGWTIEEINSVIYNYASILGENTEDVAFTDMYMDGENYCIVFSGANKPSYTIVLDTDKYLIRIDS